jgi:hypothetical protein
LFGLTIECLAADKDKHRDIEKRNTQECLAEEEDKEMKKK